MDMRAVTEEAAAPAAVVVVDAFAGLPTAVQATAGFSHLTTLMGAGSGEDNGESRTLVSDLSGFLGRGDQGNGDHVNRGRGVPDDSQFLVVAGLDGVCRGGGGRWAVHYQQ